MQSPCHLGFSEDRHPGALLEHLTPRTCKCHWYAVHIWRSSGLRSLNGLFGVDGALQLRDCDFNESAPCAVTVSKMVQHRRGLMASTVGELPLEIKKKVRHPASPHIKVFSHRVFDAPGFRLV